MQRQTGGVRTACAAAGVIAIVVTAGSSAEAAEGASPPARSFSVQRTEEGVLVTENGRPVLFYQQQPKAHDGRYRYANYVHPLYDLDGRVLTEDSPADHPHHHGVFWSWHQVLAGGRRAGNSWTNQDFLTEVTSVEVLRQDEHAVELAIHAEWTSSRLIDEAGRPIPFVEERTVLRVHRRSDAVRKIDFEIGLKALVEDVQVGGSTDAKGYGGFSVRVRLPGGVKFTGTRGEIEPQLTAVDAGPWVDLSASDWGLSILAHPENPVFPPPWILRRQRAMQNPAWPGRHPVALPDDEPLTLRYRLVIHRGKLDRDALDRLHAEYGGETAGTR